MIHRWIKRFRPPRDRFRFEISDAVLQGPEGDIQTYLDRQSLRKFLSRIHAERPMRTALEIGCGYGRLTVVLSEFAQQVVGLEREEKFVRLARALLPHFQFLQQDAAEPFPLGDESCDLVMTFLVLQHLPIEDCRKALQEAQRVVSPGGYVLLVEKNVPGMETKNISDRRYAISRHRSLGQYQEMLSSFQLVESQPRPVEPLYRFNPGGFMLFKKSKNILPS